MSYETQKASSLNFLAMKGKLEKMGSKGSEYIIKWEDLSVDFTQNLRDDYGNLDDLDSLEFGMIQPIVGYVGDDGKFHPCDGFRRLSWMKRRLEQGLSIPEIKVTLNFESATTEGRIKLILNSATAKSLSLVEQGKGYVILRDECGFNNTQIAEVSHKTVAHIGQCIRLVETNSDEVLEAIESNMIAPSEVIKINSALPKEEAEELLTEVIEAAKESGNKATGKTIKEAKERKQRQSVADKPSQFSDNGDEFVEHASIANFLSMLSKEQWKEMEIGDLRVVLDKVNNTLYH